MTTAAPEHGTTLLSGVRAIEFATSIGAAFCGKLLAEMGVDVIMVEPPEGHCLRRAGPRIRGPDGFDVGALFLYLAAGKQSTVRDRTAGAPAELLAGADLVIHDLPDRAAVAAGLDPASLHAARRDIVAVAVTPFGCSGPYAERRATDLTVFALSGQLHMTGLGEREPLLPYGHQPALFGGLLGAEVALAALLRSRNDGAGRMIDISQQEALASALDTALNRYTYQGEARGRYGNRLQDRTPLTDVYRTKDGYFVICVYTETQWRAFCSLIDRPDWLSDKGLRTLAGRLRRGDELEPVIGAWFAARTSREALSSCQAHRLPSCIVASVGELLDDPQLAARQHFASVQDATVGTLRYPKLPFVMSTGMSREGRVPALGEYAIPKSEPTSDQQRAVQASLTSTLPLEGIRVLDVTHAWAGPFATLQLGFLGADVIKVEGSRRPDGTRYVSMDARKLSPAYESGGYYHEWNRNKRAVALNMNMPEGRHLLRALICCSDVLVSNFSARVLPAWGLDWNTIQKVNPRLVLVTMPAFGSQGPWRDYVGYGETIEGAGGLTRLSGYERQQPVRCGTAYPDPLAGHYGALAVTLGLLRRAQQGSGMWLDLSHQECVLHMIGEAVLGYQLTDTTTEPAGNARPDLLLNEVLPCAGSDEWVAVSIETASQCQAVAALIGSPSSDPSDLRERLRRWTMTRSKNDAMSALVRIGLPAGAVLKVSELLTDPHLNARGFFERVRHPVVGPKLHPRPGFSIYGASVNTRCPAPLFDSATDDVLRTLLGKDNEEIALLRECGAIGGKPAGSPLPS